MTLKEAVAKFIEYAKQYDKTAPNHHWYVGITNDLKERKNRHEKEKCIECRYMKALVQVNDRGTALKVESELEKVGFAKTTEDLEPITLNASATKEIIDIYIYQAVKI